MDETRGWCADVSFSPVLCLSCTLLKPYAALWAGVMLVYFPNGITLFMRMAKNTNNTTPRLVTARLMEGGGLYARLQWAHYHLLEGYPLFAAAVLSAMQAGVSPSVVGDYATLWVAFRVAYIAAYAGGVNELIASFRSLSFAMCCLVIGQLFLLAMAAAP